MAPADQAALAAVMEGVAAGSIELFGRLSASARDYFLRLVEPMLRGEGGDMAALEALYAVDYERIPPDPATFLDSTDYLGHTKTELFPAWRPIILRACDPAAGIFELDITGASSLGKTYCACVILAYKLCRLFCLRDPSAFYGLGSRTKIFFGLFTYAKKMLRDVGFYDLRDQMLDQSPFFRDVYPREPHGNEYIRWPQKAVEVLSGSNELHAIGRALFAVLVDELNFFAQGEGTVKLAHDLVSEVSRRLEGRFVDFRGGIPGIAIYISQTRTTSDYLEQRIREKKGMPGVLCVRGPRWAFNPKGYDPTNPNSRRGFQPGDPTFRVYAGNESSDPRILDRVDFLPGGDVRVAPIDDASAPQDGILHVPVTHYRAHLDDLHGALRNIDDVPTGAFMPFFPRREIIEHALDPRLPFPFNAQVIPCYEGAAFSLRECFNHELMARVYMNRLSPIRHPTAPRFVHLDLAQGGGTGGQNDRAGFAMVHPSDHRIVTVSPLAADGMPGAPVGSTEVVKEVEVDFYVALTGGPFGEPIDFKAVRIFLSYLRDIGFWIRLVTGDQFQSFDMLQRLREAGFETDRQSADATSQPWRDLRQAFNEGRVHMPWPVGVFRPRPEQTARQAAQAGVTKLLVYQELSGLEHDVKRDKVDHRELNPDGTKGSKDIADALACSVFRCLADEAQPGQTASREAVRGAASRNLDRYLSRLRP